MIVGEANTGAGEGVVELPASLSVTMKHPSLSVDSLVALDWGTSSFRGWLLDTEGTVLETELERDDGRAIYEIDMLGPQGQMVEFEFDASNGELLGIEGVNIEGMRR